MKLKKFLKLKKKLLEVPVDSEVQEIDKFFIDLTEDLASFNTDNTSRVGACIVKDG